MPLPVVGAAVGIILRKVAGSFLGRVSAKKLKDLLSAPKVVKEIFEKVKNKVFQGPRPNAKSGDIKKPFKPKITKADVNYGLKELTTSKFFSGFLRQAAKVTKLNGFKFLKAYGALKARALQRVTRRIQRQRITKRRKLQQEQRSAKARRSQGSRRTKRRGKKKRRTLGKVYGFGKLKKRLNADINFVYRRTGAEIKALTPVRTGNLRDQWDHPERTPSRIAGPDSIWTTKIPSIKPKITFKTQKAGYPRRKRTTEIDKEREIQGQKVKYTDIRTENLDYATLVEDKYGYIAQTAHDFQDWILDRRYKIWLAMISKGSRPYLSLIHI